MNVKIDEPQQADKSIAEKIKHEKMQKELLPGPEYGAWLQWLHRYIYPETYLEIGVNTGRSLQYALPKTQCIGVDPNPVLEYPLSDKTKIYDIESDTYFATQNTQELLGGPIELAFVDGLHHYDQVLKDFINIEQNSKKQTVVLFHDIYPVVPETATREWNTFYWAGDTWKFMHILKEYRPDLTIRTIPTFPTGLGFVTNLDPKNLKLQADYYNIVEEFKGMQYVVDNAVNLVTNNYEDIRKCLI